MIVSREVHAAFTESLRDLDVTKAKRCWAQVFPHIPPPPTDADALAMLHISRTKVPVVSERERYRSHRWLIDHGFPSYLPDELKAKCERLYSVVSIGVGISVNFRSDALKPLRAEVERAMRDEVLDAEAHGKIGDAEFLRARLSEAKASAIKRMLR